MAKVGYLEGLRGIAALVVVNEHLLKFLFPLAFSDVAMRHSEYGLMEELSFPPFNMLHNGAMAVCLFFVLSGYVLSHGFFKQPKSGPAVLIAKAVGRYVRLALPVAGSLLLVWLLMQAGLLFFNDMVSLTGSKEINPYINTPGLLDLLKQSFGTALFRDNAAYNPPLWTMSVEMIGSLAIFLLQALFATFHHHRWAWWIRMAVYAGLIALIFPTLYTGFILGMMLCDAMANKKAHEYLARYARYWAPVALLIGLVLLGYMIRGLYTNPYRLMTIREFSPYHEYLYNTWGAFFLLAGIAYCRPVAGFLEKPLFAMLGKLSFPLYLTHYTVMCSLTAGLYLILPIDGHTLKAGIAILASLPVMLLIACLFQSIVNQPAIKLSRIIHSQSNVCFNHRGFNSPRIAANKR